MKVNLFPRVYLSFAQWKMFVLAHVELHAEDRSRKEFGCFETMLEQHKVKPNVKKNDNGAQASTPNTTECERVHCIVHSNCFSLRCFGRFATPTQPTWRKWKNYCNFRRLSGNTRLHGDNWVRKTAIESRRSDSIDKTLQHCPEKWLRSTIHLQHTTGHIS